LKAEAEQTGADLRVKYEDGLESLITNLEAAGKKIEELGKHGESSLEDTKRGAEKIWNENMKARLRPSGYTDGNLRQKKGVAHGTVYSI
jgi:hypothetical protein